MTSRTSLDFLERLRRYRVLEPDQLNEVEEILAPRFAEPKDLAREILQRGWLTAYQVNQLLQEKPQELRLGSYILVERLGQGGMGSVFKARHEKLDRIVALKVVRKDLLAGAQALRRFRHEIRAAAQLNHPHIVLAYDADEADGTHFYAMQYVPGVDLARWLKKNGPLPVAAACVYARQAALGLQHAHEKGLVHRDIKPANLLLTGVPPGPPAGPASDGTEMPGRPAIVKILDFGLARLARSLVDDDNSSTLTREGTVMGSLDYLAPEQANNAHAVDIRADLYSLGCTLYHLLTGTVPFPGGTLAEKLYRHQFQEPVAPEQLRPDVTPAITTVVRTLMAKRPEHRYQTPADAALALAAVQGAAPVSLPAVTEPASDHPDSPTFEFQAATDTAEEARASHRLAERRRWLVLNAAGAALLLAVLGFLGFLLVSTRSRPAPGTPVTEEEVTPAVVVSPPPPLAVAPFDEKVAQEHQRRWAAHLRRDVQETNRIGMKLALIPPGTFLMGSLDDEPGRQDNEGPRHEVTITRPFFISVHEVTVGQFREFVQATGHKTDAELGRGAQRGLPDGKFDWDPQCTWQTPGFAQTDEYPVVCVSWNDAHAFCTWLTRKERRTYQLPTEAEWEYACRAGSPGKFGFDAEDSELSDHAWYNVNSEMQTHPVGQKKANAWGLRDMLGNAREWTADWYDRDYYRKSPKHDPPGPTDGVTRVLRGGAWRYYPGHCRAGYRFGNSSSTYRANHIGFRVVLVF
jgi:formylglycine-generating enzyme required for sulfatase activity/serine/threonine protein kinase